MYFKVIVCKNINKNKELMYFRVILYEEYSLSCKDLTHFKIPLY